MSLLNFLFKKKVDSKSNFSKLEKSLGYTFSDRSLLRRALTHKSHANEHRLPPVEQNERYEFLGDAVMELVVSDRLMQTFPEATEGDLSKLRAAVVNEKSLSLLAQGISIGDYLFLGKGEEQCQGRKKDSLISDAYEAVLGAIYLDGGYSEAHRVVSAQFADLLKQATSENILKDYKTKLQEVVQEKFRQIPRYQMIEERGPDHDKVFVIDLYIKNELHGRGEGKSKKQAEQAAAQLALEKMEAL